MTVISNIQRVTSYTHTQSTPAAVWTITHNLRGYPPVTVVDSAGTKVLGEVVYTSINVITLTFVGTFAGVAYIGAKGQES